MSNTLPIALARLLEYVSTRMTRMTNYAACWVTLRPYYTMRCFTHISYFPRVFDTKMSILHSILEYGDILPLATLLKNWKRLQILQNTGYIDELNKGLEKISKYLTKNQIK